METADRIASAALILTAVNFLWTFFTYRRQTRLDERHRALEQEVMNAQLTERDEAARANRRRLSAIVSSLSEQVAALRDRKHTPDGLRGAALWDSVDLARLCDAAAQLSDPAGHAAEDVVTALNQADGLARPHLIKNVRVQVGAFDPEQFGFELRTAERGLELLRAELANTK